MLNFVLFLFSLRPDPVRQPLRIQTIRANLFRNDRLAQVTLNPHTDPSLRVYRDGKCLWSGIRKSWGAWKLMSADLDGDGRQEIVVLLYKRTRYLSTAHNCVFIYGCDGKSIYPRWLGSRLTQPFDDILVMRSKGAFPDRLVAAEHRLDGKLAVSVLKWNGFGFRKEWETGAWNKLKLISATPNEITVKADGMQRRLHGGFK